MSSVTFPSQTVLSRFPRVADSDLSPLQHQVDPLVSGFVEQATDLKTLAALTVGGLAYRYGKIAATTLGEGHVAAMPLRILSVGFGLGSEVMAFEFTNRTFQTVGANLVFAHPSGRSQGSPLQDPSSNLWSWSGPGGWKQALINDALTFGLLKGAGYLSRESNVVLQHAFSSAAMVTGQNIINSKGVRPYAPTLAEQFLHAEVTNLQLGAGTSLVHAMAPGVSSLERGLDLSLQTNVGAGIPPPLPWNPKWTLAEPLFMGNRSVSEGPYLPPSIFAMGNRGDSSDRHEGESELPKASIPLTRMQAVISRLQEISKEPIPEIKVRTPYGTVHLQPAPRFNAIGQLIRKLQATAMSGPLAWEFESILWDFEPAANDASSETFEKNLENVSRRVFEYYLQNRDLFYSLPEEPILNWQTLHEREEKAFSPFWELNSVPDSRIYDYQASTPMTFSYLQQSKEPLYMAVFRVPDQDVTRILLTENVLKEMEDGFRTQGKFNFYPQKEAAGGASFELKKEDYLGTNPTTPYTLAQLGAEVFLSPPLFKALFGLMDYLGVQDTDPALAEGTKRELQRLGTLLLLGANERQVLDTFRKRILKKYYQNRESFIERMDFLRYDENFSFLQQLSPHLHILSPELRGAFFRFLNESHLSLYFNAETVMVLGMLRRIYQTRNQHLIHQLHYQVPNDEPAAIPHWISRYYFEHRDEILGLLQSNGVMD